MEEMKLRLLGCPHANSIEKFFFCCKFLFCNFCNIHLRVSYSLCHEPFSLHTYTVFHLPFKNVHKDGKPRECS